MKSGGENILMASLHQVQADVDDHIEPQFDVVSDVHAIAVGIGDIAKKIVFDGLAIPYHMIAGNRFTVREAKHPLASITQGAKNTVQSIKDVKPVSAVVNAFQTATDAVIEDITRFGGMFQHTLEQVEGSGI